MMSQTRYVLVEYLVAGAQQWQCFSWLCIVSVTHDLVYKALIEVLVG